MLLWVSISFVELVVESLVLLVVSPLVVAVVSSVLLVCVVFDVALRVGVIYLSSESDFSSPVVTF